MKLSKHLQYSLFQGFSLINSYCDGDRNLPASRESSRSRCSPIYTRHCFLLKLFAAFTILHGSWLAGRDIKNTECIKMESYQEGRPWCCQSLAAVEDLFTCDLKRRHKIPPPTASSQRTHRSVNDLWSLCFLTLPSVMRLMLYSFLST